MARECLLPSHRRIFQLSSWSGLLLVILAFVGLSSAGSAYDEVRLSDVSVLLPYNARVSHTVEAFNGCFTWKTSNPSLVSLRVEDPCGRRVVISVRAEASPQGRQSAWLTAEEKATGRILRTELFVDDIDRIEVLTTTRTMYKDDIERLEVRAFDRVGNVFSNIQGLAFEWAIQQEKAVASTSILKIVSFKEAGVETNAVLKALEGAGKQSSVILVRGMQTGRVRVSARLVDTSAAAGEALLNEVLISVFEPLQLYPSVPVYVAPETYEANTWKQNEELLIPMPNQKFRWGVTNSSVAVVDQSGLARTLLLGSTMISCEFADLPDNSASTQVFVVEPSYLGLEIIDLLFGKSTEDGQSVNIHNWYLVQGRDYNVKILVFDVKNHRFWTTDGLTFTVTLDPSRIKALKWTPNKATFNASMLMLGDTEIEAGLNWNNLQFNLRQPIHIVAPVSIVPKNTVHLPLDPTISHTYSLRSSGGSGSYTWTSDNLRSSVVNMQGVITGEDSGNANVRCADAYNSQNFDEVLVEVTQPVKLRVVSGPTEIAVAQILPLSVAALDNRDLFYSNCSVLPLLWEITDATVISETTLVDPAQPLEEGACARKYFRALKEGTTEVKVTYRDYTISILVVVYKPLEISQHVATVTLASSITLAISGGPGAWPLDQSRFFEEVKATLDSSAVAIQSHRHHRRSGNDMGWWRLYTITCLKYHSQNITIDVGNRPGDDHPHPRTEHATVAFHCHPPHAIYIYPVPTESHRIPDDAPQDCAEAMRRIVDTRGQAHANSLVADYRIRSDRTVRFNLVAFDEFNRQYHNHSSLVAHWESTNKSVLFVLGEDDTPLKLNNVDEHSIQRVHQHLRDITFSPLITTASVAITIKSYSHEHLMEARISHSAPKLTPLNNSFKFTLYPALKLEPTRLSLYLHPKAQDTFLTVGGSGYFATTSNTTKVARIVPSTDPGTRSSIHVAPLAEGVASVSVYDRCLPTDSVTASLFVSDIHSIELRGRDIVELSHAVPMNLLVKDLHGYSFPESQYSLFNLTFSFDNSGIQLSPSPQTAPLRSRYDLIGRVLGPSSVSATAFSQGGLKLSSPPHLVHVFPKFRLQPSSLVLVPGAEFQLQWIGGPPMRATVEFEALKGGNHIITEPNADGLISALVEGVARVEAKAFAQHPTEPDVFEVGRDYFNAEVRFLSGLAIRASTSRIFVGDEDVIEVRGNRGESPFSWANMPVKFEWHVRNSRVFQLAPLNGGALIPVDEEDSVGVRIRALSPGKTIVSVTVSEAPVHSRLQGLTAQITLEAIEPLHLLSPSELIIAPGSTYQIRTNYDHDPSKILYYTLLSRCSGVDLKVVTPASSRSEFIDEEVQPSDELSETSSDIVTVLDGRISAGHTAGVAFIYVSDSPDSPGTQKSQSLLVKVVIKPIHSISLESVPAYPSSAFTLPVGAQHRSRIIARDNRGQAFHSFDSVSFSYQMNVLSVVGVNLEHQAAVLLDKSEGSDAVSSTAAVVLSGLSPGKGMLHVYTASLNSDAPELSTYVELEVLNAIQPAFPTVHVGGAIRFKTNFVYDSSLYQRAWSSSDPSIVQVDSATGFATALRAGQATIYHNSSVQTRAVVTVTLVHHLAFSAPVLTFASETSAQLSFDVDVFDANHHRIIESMDNIFNNVTLLCQISASPARDLSATARGRTCLISLRVAPGTAAATEFTRTLSQLERPLAIQVTAGDLERKMTHSDVAHVVFAPVFFVETDLPIKLTNDKPAIKVPVRWRLYDGHDSLPSLDITTSSDQIEVYRMNTPLNATMDYYYVGLRLSETVPKGVQTAKLQLANPLTNQKLSFTVVVDTTGSRRDDTSSSVFAQWQYFWVTFFMILGGVITILVISQLTAKEESPRAPKPAAALATPMHEAPMARSTIAKPSFNFPAVSPHKTIYRSQATSRDAPTSPVSLAPLTPLRHTNRAPPQSPFMPPARQ